MKNDDNSQPVWIFEFAIESESGELVPQSSAAELLERILELVEDRGLQIGGGYRIPKPEELEPGPIFELRDE